MLKFVEMTNNRNGIMIFYVFYFILRNIVTSLMILSISLVWELKLWKQCISLKIVLHVQEVTLHYWNIGTMFDAVMDKVFFLSYFIKLLVWHTENNLRI